MKDNEKKNIIDNKGEDNDNNNCNSIPLIDITPFINHNDFTDEERLHVAMQWDDAFSKFGFASITGHGVDENIISNLYNGCDDFFLKSNTDKLKYNFDGDIYGGNIGGYTRPGIESVSRSYVDGKKTALADLVENYLYKAETDSNIHPMEFQLPANEYVKSLNSLLTKLHEISALALGLEDKEFFQNYYNIDNDILLKFAYYRPILKGSKEDLESDSGAIRYGAHTDYLGLTILYQDPKDAGVKEQGGLEVYDYENKNWIPVTPVKNAFVINAGDIFPIWTNDKWKSAYHRVTNPPKGSSSRYNSRMSMAYFSGPMLDLTIEPIQKLISEENPSKYEPVKVIDHFNAKLRKSNV